jgi:hypothetical protein
VRISELALLLALASPPYAFAQTGPAEKQPVTPNPATPTSKLTIWQTMDWSANVKRCVQSYEPIRHPVSLTVTIGRDGMMAGDPEIASPIDSDEFRDDVKTVVKKLHQCEPLIVDPSGLNKGPFRQPFNFLPRQLDEEVSETVREYFKKCYTRAEIGPEVRVELKYKSDGTFAESPRPLNPESTAEYSSAAARVIDQLSKCPPLEFTQDKYSQVQRFTWTFSTVESAAAHRSKTDVIKFGPKPNR